MTNNLDFDYAAREGFSPALPGFADPRSLHVAPMFRRGFHPFSRH
ncbi:hypothetical protein [Deinococcus sp.]